MLFSDKTALRIALLRMNKIAIAPNTPIAVDTSADNNATTIVLIKITSNRVSSKTAA